MLRFDDAVKGYSTLTAGSETEVRYKGKKIATVNTSEPDGALSSGKGAVYVTVSESKEEVLTRAVAAVIATHQEAQETTGATFGGW